MSEREPAAEPQVSAPVEQDRRAYVRLASDMPVVCSSAARSREPGWAGRLRDISRGGVGLLLQHRFGPGTELTIDLKTSAGTSTRSVQAQVVHATAVLVDGLPCWLLGCALDSPLSEQDDADLS